MVFQETSARKWLDLFGRVVFTLGAAVALVGVSYSLPREVSQVPDPDRSAMEPQVAAKIQASRQAVLEAPDSHEAWGKLGMVFQAHGLETEASECYRSAIELEPEELRWHYLLAHALRDVDREAALAQAERARKVAPGYAPTYLLQAELVEEENHVDLAMELYENALMGEPRSAMAEFGLGRLYLSKGELQASLRHLLRAAELAEDARAIRAALAQVYRGLGDREAAVRQARLAAELTDSIAINDPLHYRMRQESVSSLAELARAKAAAQAGDHRRAEAIYRQLLELRPGDADMHSRLGDTLARQNKMQAAKEQYLAVLDINPRIASALYGLGNVLSFEKNYEEAALRYEQSLAIGPNHVPSLANLGSIRVYQGKLEEAEALFRRGLELDPESFECHRQMGQFMLLQRKPAEAVSHLEAALASKPDLGPLHVQLAAALAASRDFQGAWEHAREAERLGATLPPHFLEALERQLPESQIK